MQLISSDAGVPAAIGKSDTAYTAEGATNAAEILAAAAKLHREPLWREESVQGRLEGARATEKSWSNAAGFDEKAPALERAADAMIAASGQDQAAVGAAMGGFGGACKACHKSYRSSENS